MMYMNSCVHNIYFCIYLSVYMLKKKVHTETSKYNPEKQGSLQRSPPTLLYCKFFLEKPGFLYLQCIVVACLRVCVCVTNLPS